MKKKILIGVESLGSGGVEVSLIRLLNLMSKNECLNIDLLLLKKEGIYLNQVPKNVNIISFDISNEMYFYDNKFSYIKNVKGFSKLKFIIYRLKLSFYLKIKRWDLYYKLLLSKVNNLNKEYDLAIDFLGYGHFLNTCIIDKVTANKKIMFVHDEKNDWINKSKSWILKYDKIFAVSKASKEKFVESLNEVSNKIDLFYNIIETDEIKNKSKEKLDDKKYLAAKNKIVTIGRLEWQKGYDIAIKTAKILKDDNIDFNWYIIGGGTLEEEIKQQIIENDLSNNVHLLGMQKNPYKYLSEAKVYVQTSRHEGFGMAICEAKILNVPVIATKLECIEEQITDDYNGYLCKLDEVDFANKIKHVLNDEKKLKELKNNLSKEVIDFSKELNKIYKLMEE